MKQPAVTPIRNTSAISATEPLANAEGELQWIDEVAALLPEESRLGWYKNVSPWLRMLPPDNEIAHLAYSMGYLALLARSTPELIAAERVQLAALFHRLTEEMTGLVKTTAVYHQALNYRLKVLPGEIAQGLSPTALAAEIVDGVKDQFLHSGVSESGRQLKEQGNRLRQLVAGQGQVLTEFRQQLNDSRSHVTWVREQRGLREEVNRPLESRNAPSAVDLLGIGVVDWLASGNPLLLVGARPSGGCDVAAHARKSASTARGFRKDKRTCTEMSASHA